MVTRPYLQALYIHRDNSTRQLEGSVVCAKLYFADRIYSKTRKEMYITGSQISIFFQTFLTGITKLRTIDDNRMDQHTCIPYNTMHISTLSPDKMVAVL